MTDDDRRWLAELFDIDAVPADVVPGRGLTREALLQQNEMAGTWQAVTIPGEVILDTDGTPAGVGPSTTQTVYVAAAIVTRTDLDRAGVTPDEVPNLTVLDLEPRRPDQ